MAYHRVISLLVCLLTMSMSIMVNAQSPNQSDDTCRFSLRSNGDGKIIFGQYYISSDKQKVLRIRKNSKIGLSFSPGEGCVLYKLSINGQDMLPFVKNNHITFKISSARVTVVATFKGEGTNDDYVLLTMNPSSGGVLYCNGQSIKNTLKEFKVKKGSRIRIKCTPEQGFSTKTISINGVVGDNESANFFTIEKDTRVDVTFSPINTAESNDERPKFVMNVAGPGKAFLSGEVQGVVPGNPEDPLRGNKEEFRVMNGGSITIKLDPVKNIKKFVVESKDLTQTVKSSNGLYTVGVTHQFPKYGTTYASVEFAQNYNIEVHCNKYGKYTALGNLKKTDNPNVYVVESGVRAQIRFVSNLHCRIAGVTANGVDISNRVTPSQTVVSGSGPVYDLDLDAIKQDSRIVVNFMQDPQLTITCGPHGSADRALDMRDPTGYVHYLDPDYKVNQGSSKTFYEPSAAKSSNYNGKPWVLRMYSVVGYRLRRILVNGADMTSSVLRIPATKTKGEVCYLMLGFIKVDTRVEVSFMSDSYMRDSPPKQEKWVDLGTGVKWATCNVGAENETGAGNYLTWSAANNLKVQEGRLPTCDELERLVNECHPEFTQINGINGIVFYHKSNRNIHIFIPAVGYYGGKNPNELVAHNREGLIWSSTQKSLYRKVNNILSLLAGVDPSLEGLARSVLGFSTEEKICKIFDADPSSNQRLSVRLVCDK